MSQLVIIYLYKDNAIFSCTVREAKCWPNHKCYFKIAHLVLHIKKKIRTIQTVINKAFLNLIRQNMRSFEHENNLVLYFLYINYNVHDCTIARVKISKKKRVKYLYVSMPIVWSHLHCTSIIEYNVNQFFFCK